MAPGRSARPAAPDSRAARAAPGATPGTEVTPPVALDPDARLVKDAANGDAAAFEAIVRRHAPRVLRIAWRVLGDRAEADDLLQDVLVRVHRALPKFRGDATLKTWITRVTVNAARNRIRDARRKRRHVTDSLDEPLRGAPGEPGPTRAERLVDRRADPERLAASAESARRVEAALSELPDEFREAIVLREVEGLSYAEIAEALGVELGTVKSRIARGRLRLQAALADLLPRAEDAADGGDAP